MAGFFDVCSLLLTSAFFLCAILGTSYMVRKCRALIDATKASLEEHGLVLAREDDGDKDGGGEGSKTTVLVRTSKKWMDQERYLDATQRGVMKTIHASTFGDPQAAHAHAADPSASSSGGGLSRSYGTENSSSREKIRHMRDHLLSKLHGDPTI